MGAVASPLEHGVCVDAWMRTCVMRGRARLGSTDVRLFAYAAARSLVWDKFRAACVIRPAGVRFERVKRCWLLKLRAETTVGVSR